MLLKELIIRGTEILSNAYPEREAREIVFSYLESSIGTRRYTHIVEPDYMVPDEDASSAVEAFGRMAAGEPLQYVTGEAFFHGRTFRVTPAVLIPRPETEILCREAVNFMAGFRESSCKEPLKVLDLCTGSGCIAWTLALELPGTMVTAVDISDDALTVASSQDFSDEISRTGACAPRFTKADVLAGPEAFLPYGGCDVLVSNPPYVMDMEKALMRTNVLDHEPHLALFVPDDDPLIFYRAIVRWALAFLRPGGYGIIEINEALGPQTSALFLASGFRDVEIIRDLSDRDRFVSFVR